MKRLLIPVFVALILVSCGGAGGDAGPAGVAEKFSKAMYDQNIEEAKKYASKESAQMLDMIGGMMSMMPDSAKANQPEFKFEVLRDSVAGDRAWVWTKNEDGSSGDPMELKKEEGEWKVVFSKN